MSLSTLPSITQYCAGSYSEALMPACHPQHYHIRRLVPVLEGVAGSVNSAQHTITQDDLKHPSTTKFILKWRGLTAEQVRRNFLPVKLHYKQQLLLLEERRMRGLILNEEFTCRLEVGIHCRYSAPSRELLLTWVPAESFPRRVEIMREEMHCFHRMISMLTHSRHQSNSNEALNTPSVSSIVTTRTPWTELSAATRTVPKRNLGVAEESLEPHNASEDRESSVETVPIVSRHLSALDETMPSGCGDVSPKKDNNEVDSLAVSLFGVSLGSDDSLACSIGGCESPFCDDSLTQSIVGDALQHTHSFSYDKKSV